MISHVSSGYGLSLGQSVDARGDGRTESEQLSARFMGLLNRRVDIGEKQPEASTFCGSVGVREPYVPESSISN